MPSRLVWPCSRSPVWRSPATSPSSSGPADVSNPDAAFETKEVKIPKRSELKTTNWPIYGLNPERTRYFPGKFLDPPFVSAKWSLPIGHLIEHGPVIGGDDLFILDLEGIVYSVDKKTGKVNWKKDFGELSAAAPAYYDGIVYALNLDPDQIVAIRAKDGKELWRKSIGSPGSESSPMVVGKKLIFGCQCGSVYAMNPKTGELLWSTQTAGEVKGAVAFHDGVVFGSNYGGEFFAIDASDGDFKWRTPIIGGAFGRGGGAYSTPAVAYGRVYVGAFDGRVYSLDEDTGEIAWTHSTGAEVYPGPVVADVPGAPPAVYIGSADGNAYALNAQTGGVLLAAEPRSPDHGLGRPDRRDRLLLQELGDRRHNRLRGRHGQAGLRERPRSLQPRDHRRRARLLRRLRHRAGVRVRGALGQEGQGKERDPPGP